MKREIVKIDESLCNGCGDCIPNCHEGALQIIDGKARLVSDLLCDGLGACIGHCPLGAISIESREAEPYSEQKAIASMLEKGVNTVKAHLEHLLDHNENGYFKEAMEYLTSNEDKLTFSLAELKNLLKREETHEGASFSVDAQKPASACGCPGSAERSFAAKPEDNSSSGTYMNAPSQLTQWPVQMHLINPAAGFFQGADVVLAADCVGYSLGNFHQKYLKGKALAIACPKLDQGRDIYVEKIRHWMDEAKINTLQLMIMEVPCCGGLRQMVEAARSQAKRKVPVKQSIVSVTGTIISEDWI